MNDHIYIFYLPRRFFIREIFSRSVAHVHIQCLIREVVEIFKLSAFVLEVAIHSSSKSTTRTGIRALRVTKLKQFLTLDNEGNVTLIGCINLRVCF